MRSQFRHGIQSISDPENLFSAWKEFLSGKSSKADVQAFARNVADNILELSDELGKATYKHGSYHEFSIADPKPRLIHKALVRDRVLHHAVYRQLYPFFDNTFIADSFSCRINKGTHKALDRFQTFGRKVSRNNTRTCWILKCDIKKFFASIDQSILLDILKQYIPNQDILALLQEIIGSFLLGKQGIGLPLGNLTSQLFVNVYMNEFDQFVKHKLRVKYYLRYADDFALFSENKNELIALLSQMQQFLTERLHLTMHPQKIFLQTLASGVDFLGWVHFPQHRVLRTTTKKRMFRRLRENPKNETLQSYLGMLQHGNAFKIRQEVENSAWLWHTTETASDSTELHSL